MAKNPLITLLDPGQIVKRVYDESQDRIRVDAQVTATMSGSQEVVISQYDDSIAIGDGSNLFTGTDVNAKHGLDVNVIGGVVSGEFTSSGLGKGLRSQRIIVTDQPTKVPLIPLADRNGMSIRIWGSNFVYFGNSDVTVNEGYPKRQYEEIVLDVKDNAAVELYAVCDPGLTCELRIMELA